MFHSGVILEWNLGQGELKYVKLILIKEGRRNSITENNNKRRYFDF